ncbi:hypothetical protein DFH27DRAFT_616209 [Peziza echinospora]|nr:hypothetical protein DFH27DRAFT_616209 [Peziza echinospora]
MDSEGTDPEQSDPIPDILLRQLTAKDVELEVQKSGHMHQSSIRIPLSIATAPFIDDKESNAKDKDEGDDDDKDEDEEEEEKEEEEDGEERGNSSNAN